MQELRIDMRDWSEESRYAQYNLFHVGPESDKFRLTVNGYSGDAGMQKILIICYKLEICIISFQFLIYYTRLSRFYLKLLKCNCRGQYVQTQQEGVQYQRQR